MRRGQLFLVQDSRWWSGLMLQSWSIAVPVSFFPAWWCSGGCGWSAWAQVALAWGQDWRDGRTGCSSGINSQSGWPGRSVSLGRLHHPDMLVRWRSPCSDLGLQHRLIQGPPRSECAELLYIFHHPFPSLSHTQQSLPNLLSIRRVNFMTEEEHCDIAVVGGDGLTISFPQHHDPTEHSSCEQTKELCDVGRMDGSFLWGEIERALEKESLAMWRLSGELIELGNEGIHVTGDCSEPQFQWQMRFSQFYEIISDSIKKQQIQMIISSESSESGLWHVRSDIPSVPFSQL